MAPAPGIHIPLRYLRGLLKKGTTLLRNRITTGETSNNARAFLSKTQVNYEPAYARIGGAQRHPFQQRLKVARRWYTTHFSEYLNSTGRQIGATARAGPEAASRYSTSKIGAAVSRLTTTSPFAHTLRPRLTGGALPRTASGYSLGNGGVNGARYFSHSNPTAQAQVIAQVTAGIRAFLLQGKEEVESMMKQRRTGIKGEIQASIDQIKRQKQTANPPKGSFVDFNLAPTITCLSPLRTKSVPTVTLEKPGLMEELSIDVAFMINDLSVILSDIQKMKTELGDLPIALITDPRTPKICLRIYFPNRDPVDVESLCEEAGIRRGVVSSLEEEEDPTRAKDKAWGEAFELLMPTLTLPNRNPTPVARSFCDEPTTVYNSGEIHWSDMLSTSPRSDSLPSKYRDVEYSDDGYDDVNGSFWEEEPVDVAHESLGSISVDTPKRDYHGLQSIHRFLEECEEYRTTRNPWSR